MCIWGLRGWLGGVRCDLDLTITTAMPTGVTAARQHPYIPGLWTAMICYLI